MKLLQLSASVFYITGVAACAAEQDTSEPNSVATSDLSKVEGDSAVEKIGRLMAFNPGSHQVAANAVQLDEGVTVIVPTESDGAPRLNSASGRCRGGNLCLFEHSDFNGSILQLSGSCRTVDLSGFNTDTGLPWNNRASSIDNPSPRPGAATFFNNGNFMLTLNDGHFLRNLASDSSAEGGNANDKIDTVRICP